MLKMAIDGLWKEQQYSGDNKVCPAAVKAMKFGVKLDGKNIDLPPAMACRMEKRQMKLPLEHCWAAVNNEKKNEEKRNNEKKHRAARQNHHNT
uniref:Uncharacterized protein n=1 Tax=Romanomermis culicivorax TaxID=13658 RepID=A0A915KVI9_ROMCU